MHIQLDAVLCMLVKLELLTPKEASKLAAQFRKVTFPDSPLMTGREDYVLEPMQHLIDGLFAKVDPKKFPVKEKV